MEIIVESEIGDVKWSRMYSNKYEVTNTLNIFQDRKLFQLTWLRWTEHLGTTSRRCDAIRSRSWLTRKEGGKAGTPPLGTVMLSLQMGHLKVGWLWQAILSKQWRHTVWEHANSLGVCSPASYIPERIDKIFFNSKILQKNFNIRKVAYVKVLVYNQIPKTNYNSIMVGPIDAEFQIKLLLACCSVLTNPWK
jgi:hypothetical protein